MTPTDETGETVGETEHTSGDDDSRDDERSASNATESAPGGEARPSTASTVASRRETTVFGVESTRLVAVGAGLLGVGALAAVPFFADDAGIATRLLAVGLFGLVTSLGALGLHYSH